jgi:hypothetical protein
MTPVTGPAFTLLLAVLATGNVVGFGRQADGTRRIDSADVMGPFSYEPVTGRPFSARATTTITHTEDGRPHERVGIARYYRDSDGRVRVEYDVPGDQRRVLAMLRPDPADRTVYTIDSADRTVRSASMSIAGGLFNATRSFAVAVGPRQFVASFTRDVHDPIDGVVQSLGVRRLEGVEATGRRVSGGTPFQCRGCSGDVGQWDERWESVELRVVLYARHIDPGTAAVEYPGRGMQVEYRLSNLIQGEQPPDLFRVPTDYTLIQGSMKEPLIFIGFPENERFQRLRNAHRPTH